MKIRIKGNSVRFRLAQNEVSQLVNEGETWSKCDFGNSALIYGLKRSDVEEMNCTFKGERIIVSIPKQLLQHWDTDERVGFDHTEDGLYMLIEKDWQCLKPRDNEDESNLYQHPATK
jgi:hypothetical protein